MGLGKLPRDVSIAYRVLVFVLVEMSYDTGKVFLCHCSDLKWCHVICIVTSGLDHMDVRKIDNLKATKSIFQPLQHMIYLRFAAGLLEFKQLVRGNALLLLADNIFHFKVRIVEFRTSNEDDNAGAEQETPGYHEALMFSSNPAPTRNSHHFSLKSVKETRGIFAARCVASSTRYSGDYPAGLPKGFSLTSPFESGK